MVTVVGGASGIVGSGIAIEFLKQGAVVWAPMRTEQRFEELKAITPNDLHGRLRFYKSDLATEEDFERLRNEILKKDAKINHVVSCFGGWQEHGLMSTVKLKDFKEAMDYYVNPHFLMYTTFAKILSETPKSTFTSIQGGGAEAEIFFVPKASIFPIVGRALAGIMVSAKTEFKDNPNIRFIEYRISTWVRKEADEKFKTEDFEVGHDYVAKFLPKMILKHETACYRLKTRREADKAFESLN